MKTIQVRDDAMVILANEMSDKEIVEFLDKWKAAIERGDHFMWADVIVLGELKEQKAELTPEQIDQQFVDKVNEFSKVYWRVCDKADEEFRRKIKALFDKTGSKATITKIEVK